MKKTLWSMVAGLAVIGSAFAVPSLDTQQQNCEGDPNFVWVEKTKTCVPINPCESDDMEIEQAYCIRPDFRVPTKVSNGEFLSLVIEKYFQNVMKTNVSSIWPLMHPLEEHYICIKTSDKGYYVVDFDTNLHPSDNMQELYKAACWAYGKIATNAGIPETNFEMKCDDTTESECESIVGFANSLLQSIGKSGRIYLRYLDDLRNYNRCYMAIYAY